MGSLLRKIAELDASGELPQFDPTNVSHVLYEASERGLKSQILYTAMDLIRDNPALTNDEAILAASKSWNLI